MKGALVVILGSLVLASGAQAVTLVNADGTPVGGVWQQWADEMRVPTYQGTATLSLVDQATGLASCGGVAASCTLGFPEPLVILGPYDQNRQILYHELGHVYDSTTVGDAERSALLSTWQLTGTPAGFDSPAWADWRSDSTAGTFSPREWFAEAYRICAAHTGRWHQHTHAPWNRAGYQYPKWYEPAACSVIRASRG